jgi:hypothetical protein
MTLRPVTLIFTAALLALPVVASAQGIPRGAATGARTGNDVAGPVGGAVGGVVGGAVGGVAGGVKGVLGVPQKTSVGSGHRRHHVKRYRHHR